MNKFSLGLIILASLLGMEKGYAVSNIAMNPMQVIRKIPAVKTVNGIWINTRVDITSAKADADMRDLAFNRRVADVKSFIKQTDSFPQFRYRLAREANLQPNQIDIYDRYGHLVTIRNWASAQALIYKSYPFYIKQKY